MLYTYVNANSSENGNNQKSWASHRREFRAANGNKFDNSSQLSSLRITTEDTFPIEKMLCLDFHPEWGTSSALDLDFGADASFFTRSDSYSDQSPFFS